MQQIYYVCKNVVRPGILVYSNTLLIELSSPSVNSVVYVKADLRLMNLALNPKF